MVPGGNGFQWHNDNRFQWQYSWVPVAIMGSSGNNNGFQVAIFNMNYHIDDRLATGYRCGSSYCINHSNPRRVGSWWQWVDFGGNQWVDLGGNNSNCSINLDLNLGSRWLIIPAGVRLKFLDASRNAPRRAYLHEVRSDA